MDRKFIKIVALGLLLNLNNVNAQTSALTNNIVDFSNIQETDGTANINIPFHDISIKGYTLQIGVGYNSSGVVVDNNSSNVGQNWELSSQGVITRGARSYFDESTEQVRTMNKYKYFPVGTNPVGGSYVECVGIKIEPAKGYLSNLNLAKQIYNDFKNFVSPIGIQTSSAPLDKIKYNLAYSNSLGTYTADVLPDVFTVVIPNKKTFKFLFNTDGKIITDSDENFKISYDKKGTDSFQEFTLTDDDGINYTFANTETYNSSIFTDNINRNYFYERNLPFTNVSSTSNLDQNTINSNTQFCVDDSYYPATPELIAKYRAPKPISWYLSKIENIYGESITYEYENMRSLNIPRTSFGATLQQNNQGISDGIASFMTGSLQILVSEVPVVKSISSNYEKLVFEYRRYRQDVISSGNKNLLKELNSIKLYEKYINQTNANNYLKRIDFNQNYIISNDANIDAVGDYGVYKRLFLNGIDISGKEGATIASYSFKYNNPAFLPQKQSYNIDFWGYYKNGDNVAVFPEVYYYNDNSVNNFDRGPYSIYKRYPNDSGIKIDIAKNPSDKNVLFKDRTPVFNDTSIGILTEIENFGGKTEFIYEPNYFDYYGSKREGGGLRISKIIKKDGNEEYTKQFFYGSGDNGMGYISAPNNYAYKRIPGSSPNLWWPEFNHNIRSVTNNNSKVHYNIIKTVNTKNQSNNGYIVNKYSYFNPYYNSNINIDGFTYISPTFNSSYFIRHQQLNSNAYYYDMENYGTYSEENLDKINGHLVNQKIYDSNNNLIQETKNSYALKYDFVPSFSADYQGGAYFSNYLLKYMLKSQIVEENFGSNILKTEKTFLHNNEGKITEIITTDPTSSEKVQLKYLYEESNDPGHTMRLQNRLNEISTIKNYKDNSMVNIKNRRFFKFSFPILNSTTSGVNTTTKNMYDLQYEENSLDGINFFRNEEIMKYGFYGNVIEKKINDQFVSTIFGYNYRFPIAVIQGANIESLSSVQNIIDGADTSLASYNEFNLQSRLDDFRNNNAHKNFKIETSVYEPLVGRKIRTNQNGSKEYSLYENSNRLKKILDQNLNIVKEFNYNIIDFEKHYNTKQEQTFTRMYCGRLENPGNYTYTVPANTYSSRINQADANQKAIEEVSQMGQIAANINGQCSRKPFDCTINTEFSVRDNLSSFLNKIEPSLDTNKFKGRICFNTRNINWAAVGRVKVGTITGICKPVTFKHYKSGLNWSLYIYSNGEVYAQWDNLFSAHTPNQQVNIYFEFPYDL